MSKAKKDNDTFDDLITWEIDEETGEIIASNIEGKKVSIKKWVFTFFVGWIPHGGTTQRWYEAVLK